MPGLRWLDRLFEHAGDLPNPAQDHRNDRR
jgi:hypothetical protein